MNKSIPQKMRIKAIIFCVSFLALAGLMSCSSTEKKAKEENAGMLIPAGWYLSLYNSSVSYEKAEEKKKGYSILLDRTSDLKDAGIYLKLAESIYPKREVIEKSITAPEENWFFERLWWYEKHKDFLVPFALTADSVNYYINKYKETKNQIKKMNAVQSGKGSSLRRVEFSYTTKVKDEGDMIIGGVSVPKIRVIMEMKWYDYCGQPCGWGFVKKREVVFAGKAKVLSISGDGPVKKWVSTKEEPYGPNQWIRF
jgi:hypothetical protein